MEKIQKTTHANWCSMVGYRYMRAFKNHGLVLPRVRVIMILGLD